MLVLDQMSGALKVAAAACSAGGAATSQFPSAYRGPATRSTTPLRLRESRARSCYRWGLSRACPTAVST